MAGETHGLTELLLRSILDSQTRIERKVDRMAHRLNQMMISTPSSPSSPERQQARAREFGLTILGWLLERSWPSLLGHVLPLIVGAALLFWHHLVDWILWAALLLRSLGG